MLAPILITFVLAFLVLFFGDLIRPKWFKFISVFPFILFIYFLAHLPLIKDGGNGLLYVNEWIPSIGVNLNFKLDGLSLLFSLLITGIGSLVFLYASSYLQNHKFLNRFYAYLTAFMGAMLGVVLADNLIVLFIFWELTSITSFFLIGFNTEDESSRKSALWALSLTGLGGFFMLASFGLIEVITGTYSIHELFTQSASLIDHRYYYILIGFLFAGAFTKSAQFPFHFWLPGAMKAPTPVSAYLHSATMVKAGIYLLARFTPILSDGQYWNLTLLIVGGITMLMGSFYSLFRTDMKGVLAYSTISALGVLVFLLGIGTESALFAVAVFILAHALYKATLFMSTGIVDHATHTRDLTLLSGLFKKMPIVAICTFIAALSCAGIPLTFGFISKELIYGSTFDGSVWTYYSMIGLTLLAFFTNVFLSASGFLAGIKPFIGNLPEKFTKIHKPDFRLYIPLVILSLFTILFGVFPYLPDFGILNAAGSAIYGSSIEQELHLWHGFNDVLLWSVATIALGLLLFKLIKPSHDYERRGKELDGFSPQTIITNLAQAIRRFAFNYTRFFHNGYLRLYIMYIIIFFIGIVGWKLFQDVPLKIVTEDLSPIRIYEVVIFLLIIAAIYLITTTSSRLTAISALGVVGFCICLIFVVYGAPDLAMTQFAIDTLTVVLFVLVLFKLPSFLKLSNSKNKLRDSIVSIAFGILIAIITLQATLYPSNKEISKFYADNAYLLAKGKNVVNVILVDYRGVDTMIETIVLSIAAVGVLSILKYKTEDGEKSEE